MKKIIFGLSHKIADFLVKNGQKTGFGQKSTTALPGYLTLGTRVQNEVGIHGYLGNPVLKTLHTAAKI